MIVCSCNVFSDRDVRGVLASGDEGPRKVRDVYGCLGCSPKCGRCARTIHELLQQCRGEDRQVVLDPDAETASVLD